MLQQFRLGNTFYGWNPSTGELVAFANMGQLQQYFPKGIDPNAPNLPVDASKANATPGVLVSPFSTQTPTPQTSVPPVQTPPQGLQMPPTPTPTPTPTPQTQPQLPIDSSSADWSRGDAYFVLMPSSHGKTVYAYDSKAQILIPINSEQAFLSLTGETIQKASADGQILTLSGPPKGVTTVPDNKGIGDDGNFVDLPYLKSTYGVGNTSTIYGKQEDPTRKTVAAQKLEKFFTMLLSTKAISLSTFDKIVKNEATNSLYVNAVAYGGYNISDIYRDAKAKELGLNVTAISPTMPASEFYKTIGYLTAAQNPSLDVPAGLNLSSALLNSPLFDIPNEAFRPIVPPVDRNSQAFKDAVAAIPSQFHDTLIQMAEADTAEKQQIASQGYQNLKEQIQSTFGFTLSNDAQAAWGQIQQLGNATSEANTLNSGIYNQALDSTLVQQRKSLEYQRTQNTLQTDQRAMSYYTQFATPSEIASLTPEQRQKYGLTPSQDLMNYVNNLATLYPGISPVELKAIRDTLIDPNGNMYSGAYRELSNKKYSINNDPEKGKKVFQENLYLKRKEEEDRRAMDPYTMPDSPYSGTTQSPTTQPPTTPPSGLQMPTTQPQPQGLQMPTTPEYNNAWTGQTTSTQQPQPPSGLQMPTAQPQPQGVQMPSNTDFSNDYGLHNGTVYNLKSGQGYSDEKSFFNDSKATSFTGIKLNNSYIPAFEKYNDGPTIFNSYTKQPISNLDSYYKQGGAKDWSNLTRKDGTNPYGF